MSTINENLLEAAAGRELLRSCASCAMAAAAADAADAAVASTASALLLDACVLALTEAPTSRVLPLAFADAVVRAFKLASLGSSALAAGAVKWSLSDNSPSSELDDAPSPAKRIEKVKN